MHLKTQCTNVHSNAAFNDLLVHCTSGILYPSGWQAALPGPAAARLSVRVWLTSGILYPWYKAVQGGTYWYVPVHPLLDTRWYKKKAKLYIPVETSQYHQQIGVKLLLLIFLPPQLLAIIGYYWLLLLLLGCKKYYYYWLLLDCTQNINYWD